MIKKLCIVLLASILLLHAVGAEFSSSATFVTQPSYQPSFQTYYGSQTTAYWPILDDKEQCKNRQDFVLNVAPAGCQPAVVRSDLLAEQNVPVFCQIDALNINPLLDVKEIRSISFANSYPKGVVAV